MINDKKLTYFKIAQRKSEVLWMGISTFCFVSAMFGDRLRINSYSTHVYKCSTR